MEEDIRAELSRCGQEGRARSEYTRRAYRMLPEMDRPRILDVGCGRGRPTLDLARLSNGRVTGLDIHQPSLDELVRKAREAGLADRVEAVNGSLHAIDLPYASYDVVWSEGSIYAIGFRRGLAEWRRLLRPEGFLVVHTMAWVRADPPQDCVDDVRRAFLRIRSVSEHHEEIPAQGYELLGHFFLPEEVWQVDYYGPVQERIQALRTEYAGNLEAQVILDGAQREVELYRRCAGWYGSAFFVMQRGDRNCESHPCKNQDPADAG